MTSPIQNTIIAEYLKKCVRCGQCRHVCPVLDIVGKESASPRGKVYLAGLIGSGEVLPDSQAESILSLCLMCGACSAECPSGLPVDSIITYARSLTASSARCLPYRSACHSFFLHANTLGAIPGFTPVLQLITGGQSALRRPLFTGISRTSRPERRKPKMKIGYFLGCGTRLLLPDVARSVVEVLTHLGCEVITPPSTCCGLPLSAEGHADSARKVMESNRRLFQGHGLDAIITDCSSCSLHLTSQGLAGDGQPVYEFCEFLVKILNPERPEREYNGAVACHYPCHLRHGRKLTGHIHQIVGLIPGARVAEIPGGSSCCGGGGTFSLKHKSISSHILKSCTDRLVSSGGAVAATVCPSCIMQLRRGLKGHSLTVSHVAQLLHASYGLSG